MDLDGGVDRSRGAKIEVIQAGEPKTSCDEDGIRWPEPVVLRGEARQVREWTVMYGRDRMASEMDGNAFREGGRRELCFG